MKIASLKRLMLPLVAAATLAAHPAAAEATDTGGYFDNSGHADAWSGGERMIPIHTPQGDYRVWVKRTGNNPELKVLLLHGGPAVPSDYLMAMDSFLPGAGIEYYRYDQLGAGNSDQPDNDDLWTVERYVEEVEQVRTALGLDKDNFCLYGQSWGGALAIEYALKYQQNLKCLVISNMMASIPAYNEYARTTLMPQLKPADLALIQQLEEEGKTDDPRYMGILIPEFYEKHILRRPSAEWPEPVNRALAHANNHIYTLMQGPSELGASGRLLNWDRFNDLHRINVPTLVIGAKYDTMDPAYMRKMAEQMPDAQVWISEQGSHMALYDDQEAYFAALTGFLHELGNADSSPQQQH
jgi:proline iminopeptidase